MYCRLRNSTWGWISSLDRWKLTVLVSWE